MILVRIEFWVWFFGFLTQHLSTSWSLLMINKIKWKKKKEFLKIHNHSMKSINYYFSWQIENQFFFLICFFSIRIILNFIFNIIIKILSSSNTHIHTSNIYENETKWIYLCVCLCMISFYQNFYQQKLKWNEKKINFHSFIPPSQHTDYLRSSPLNERKDCLIEIRSHSIN